MKFFHVKQKILFHLILKLNFENMIDLECLHVFLNQFSPIDAPEQFPEKNVWICSFLVRFRL